MLFSLKYSKLLMHMHVKRAYVLKKDMVLKQSDFFM